MQYSLYIDVSGSVSKFTDYWSNVENVFNNLNEQNKINKIFIWDSSIKEVTKEELKSFIQRTYGGGGTDPELIAKSLITNKIHSNVVIFTDGDVSDHSVSRVDALLHTHDLDNIECYIISKSTCNLSVTCPFTRNNNSRVHWKTSYTNLTTQIYEKLDPTLINTLDTINIDTFNEKYNQLESFIIARNMGRSGDSVIKEKLITLKQNLARELANRPNSNYGVEMRNHLDTSDVMSALSVAKEMTTIYFSSNIGMEIEKKVGYLISLCGDLRGQYYIGDIRSNRMASAVNVKEEKTSEVEIEINDLISKPVECPIMMDTDVPQIMVVNLGEPVLANIDKHIVDDIVGCPLRILNYPQVVAKLKPYISQWTGTQVNKHLGTNSGINPFTKQELVGTIPLGSCEQHIDCGNYTISKLFTSGKLLGNLNMYYAVIWYLIKQNTWEYLDDISDQVSEHLIYRLKNSYTYASLCGLPQYVLTKVPTDVAVWYCVNSGLLNLPTDRDTCRLHVFNMEPMLAILKELKYPVSDNVYTHINRTRVLLSMLSMSKKCNTQFRNRMLCLVQNAVRLDLENIPNQVKELESTIEWIPTDGPASQEQIEEILKSLPKFYSELSINEIVGLSKMVDASLSASAIYLQYDWVPEQVVPVINWTLYGLNNYDTSNDVQVCPYTFRPFYTINYIGKETSWIEKVTDMYGPPEKLFSGCKRFIDFYYKYNEFPNYSSFLLFCYNRYATKFQTPTLPYAIVQFVQSIIGYYKPILEIIKSKEMTIEHVISILNSSCSIVNRVQLETKYKTDLLECIV